MKKELETAAINSPIELILQLRDVSSREDLLISKSVISFYNLANDPQQKQSQKATNRIDPITETLSHLKARQLISYLNFIRFNYDQSPVKSYAAATTTKRPAEVNCEIHLVPSYSLILLTNNPLNNVASNCSNPSSVNLNSWSYQYKVELNDDQGRTLARQLFFKLRNYPSRIPLCCNSNWLSPLNTQSQQRAAPQQQYAATPQKYIIRLNMNCKNYDLMLFFYRLLFAKYPNYSKPNFTLFVLQQNDHKFKILNEINSSREDPDIEEETMLVEFQLSLKHDPNVSVEPSSSAMTLVHNVYDPAIFLNLVGLFDGFIEEVVKNRVYSIFDPDQNRIFLVNKSVGDDDSSRTSSSSSIITDDLHFLNTVGLGDKYNSSTRKQASASQTHAAGMNYSNLNSPSETASYDSSKDSANWSFSSSSNRDSDGFNYKELHLLKNNQRSTGPVHVGSLSANEHSGSVRNLIKKFNTQNTPLAGVTYPTSNKNYMSCNNLKKMLLLKKKKQHSEEDDEYEEEDESVDQEYSDDSNESNSRNSNSFLNFNKNERELRTLFSSNNHRNKPPLNSSMSDLTSIRGKSSGRNRCMSAVNEPYQPCPVAANSGNYANGRRVRRASNSNDSLLKKSKSVTFLDSIDQIDRVNSVINQRIETCDLMNRNLIQRERSKSTLPFMYSNVRYTYVDDDDDSSSIQTGYDVDVNNSNEGNHHNHNQRRNSGNVYSTGRNVVLSDHHHHRANYSNCLIDPKMSADYVLSPRRLIVRQQQPVPPQPSKPKPYVGVTPETRFRCAPTLNMIRNSRMPVGSNYSSNIGNYDQHEAVLMMQEKRNSLRNFNILNFRYPMAKF
jgi:hypothetical protein